MSVKLTTILNTLFLFSALTALAKNNVKTEAKSNISSQKNFVGVKSKVFTGSKAAVASEHKICSDIGLEMLTRGGSAMDAAISAAICLGSINCFASGIGGSMVMLVKRKKDGRVDLISGQETAPKVAQLNMFRQSPSPHSTVKGASAIAIPGELRALQLAYTKYGGRLPWRELLEPSVKLNKQGFKVTKLLAKHIRLNGDYIKKDPALKSVFMKDGRLLLEGDLCKRPVYANTLSIIANKGVDALYAGELTNKVVAEISKMGGNITKLDFAAYKAQSSSPLQMTFNGHTIVTGPVSAGGITLTSVLEILNGVKLEKESDPDSYHRIVEAFRFAFAQSSKMGEVENMELGKILEKALDQARIAMKNGLSDYETFPPAYYHPVYDFVDSSGGSALTVVSASGEAVSLVTSINSSFGAKVGSISTGIIWNDSMNEFSIPGTVNLFGFTSAPSNYIAPGKKPITFSTPILVLNPKKNLVMAIAASGGTKSITSAIQVLIRILRMNQTLEAAVNAPRLHNQLFPNKLEIEENFDPAISLSLEERGHDIDILKVTDLGLGAVQAIQAFNGRLYAVSDARKFGEASAK